MKSKTAPSLAVFARMADPFQYEPQLVTRLRSCRSESRYLEWKQTAPFGPLATKRIKYRTAKAIISFANADGGFVVCGVAPNGQWIGLQEGEVAHSDPSMITELVTGVIFPELPVLNYTEITVEGKKFIVIHTPPSHLMPHVTTKAVNDTLPDGTIQPLLAERAVYYRYAGKSDLASPVAFQRMVTRRVDMLKTDMLRRIREIPVPVPVVGKASSPGAKDTMLRVARLTDDPKAPAVRVTNDPSVASGIFLHEELSNGLFDEINNVLAANKLLAKGQRRFFLGQPLYYRVYAERQHVVGPPDLFDILGMEGIHSFYAPALFWLHRTPSPQASQTIARLYLEAKNPHVHYLLRIAFLLGRDFAEFVLGKWEKQWAEHPQPPDFFWTLKKMLNTKDVKNPVLLALRCKEDTKFPWPGDGDRQKYGALVESPATAAKYLSEACMRVFEGKDAFRAPARHLDFLAYGSLIAERAGALVKDIMPRLV